MLAACPQCQGEMTSRREDVAYAAGGLPEVVLAQLEIRTCARCGAFAHVIPRVDELHRAVAHAILRGRPERVAPHEARFLRAMHVRTYLRVDAGVRGRAIRMQLRGGRWAEDDAAGAGAASPAAP